MNANTRFLDGIRFLLALIVAVGHFYNMIGGKRAYGIPIIGGAGANAVDGFMVITGFLMMYHYILRSDKEPFEKLSTFIMFWLRRFFRLYPVYLLVIVTAFFMYNFNRLQQISILKYFTGEGLSSWGDKIEVGNTLPSFLNLFTHLTFTHGLFPSLTSGILGPAWSLSLEAQFYLLFPLLALSLFFKSIRAGKSIVLVMALIGSIIFSLEIHRIPWGQPSTILHKLPLFLTGMILASVYLRQVKRMYLCVSFLLLIPYELALNPSQNIATIAITFFIVGMLFLDSYKEILNPMVYNFLNFIKGILSNRVSQFGANISYSFYLTHILVIPFAIQWTISTTSFYEVSNLVVIIFSLVIFLTLNFLLSHLLFIWIENPFINLGKTITKRRRLKINATNNKAKTTEVNVS